MRSRLIALGLVLGVLALSGCFVLDEIDSGQQVMKKHSPRVRAEEAKKKQAPAAPAAEEEGTGLLASVKGWWSEMRSPAKAEGRPAWDPADVVVRCQLGNGTQFTRKSDCDVRGGRIL